MVGVVWWSLFTLADPGQIVFAGSWKATLYGKLPVTYCVHFCVATYGALSNARR